MRKFLFMNTALMLAVVLLHSCKMNSDKSSSNTETTSDETIVLNENLTIDLSLSKVMWSGEALGMYKHEGTVDLSEASIDIQEGEIVSGSFVADLTTITPTDENFNPEEGYTKEKLKGHLMSPDFFDVENYPSASFALDKSEGTNAMGNLKIRGYSHPEKIENISISKNEDNVEISGEMVFTRKKYDISWDYPMKDRILSDDIKLKILLVGK